MRLRLPNEEEAHFLIVKSGKMRRQNPHLLEVFEQKVVELEARIRTLESTSQVHEATSHNTTDSQEATCTNSRPESSGSPGIPPFKALQIDNGQLTFHGATSFFHLPRKPNHDAEPPPSMPLEPSSPIESGKDKLINSAWKERAFEQISITPEPMKSLLRDHWTWVSPLFNFVYRPAFTRDVKTQGPYYSPALHNTILAHSVRWAKADPAMAKSLEPYDGGAHFYRQAIATIFDDVRQGTGKIPDIQALLLLSAQAIGQGHRTQAWLYLGMAIRLVQDMGLNIDSRAYAVTARLTDEDVEIRNRLFWSCYAWEKLLCLYLGRQPVVLATHASPPSLLLDDSAEIEVWAPRGIEDYPPTQSHATSCFINMCSLSEILHRILIQMYDPFKSISEEAMMTYASGEEANLQRWWDELPDFLKMSIEDLPLHCPPSHIATLNAMYNMVRIQLHRPILCAAGVSETLKKNLERHVMECSSSAVNILNIFDMYSRTFGTGHIQTALIYCVYTAASIFLLQVQAANQTSATAVSRLKYCINALESVQASFPIINTAIKLIEREVTRLNLDVDQPHSSSTEPLELPRLSSEDPTAYEWTAVGPDSFLLPQQWGDIVMGDESDALYDDSFFLTAGMHPSSYYSYPDST
ncbi:hypothetical protein LTS07_004798 [Exophiala sideris]|uniref:Xylanolytic transcriptional activator regulatory domain-containing protein n=1 Tax=Exophiala sideris TaxID=1016849 RepID=A0ABR0JBK2_9EURO|nr:hypothetical protein LTS07_004798 [Exophiala sideris]KAK5038785.1 hypothetical protein LTR13_003816 [Exophiala sideris]KAK5060668.1 hypothetical protein LTR69_005267 [Exophiala sideris]KAK5183581.1 hypothetical protein LTR44_003863 [Eurotiomycetes sp. CCFEE 6388]